jgi:integrase
MRLAQRKKPDLKIYRRHEENCSHREQGRSYTKCGCPLWMQGVHNGEPIRQSLGTRSMQEALRQVAQLEDPHTPLLKPISEAIDAYKNHVASLEEGTRRKYVNTLKLLLAYCERENLPYMADLAVEDLDGYRSTRTLAPSTSAKELEILRLFFSFAVERKWIAENIAKKIKPPRNVQPKEVVPYEPNEITRMLAACDEIGQSRYERQRARAMLLIMRYTGLRISDVATFAKDRIRNGQIFLHTKNIGGLVFLPLPPALEKELSALPTPRGASTNSRYYFWSEVGSRRGTVSTAERTMRAVFRRSGVKGARTHRFRHTSQRSFWRGAAANKTWQTFSASRERWCASTTPSGRSHGRNASTRSCATFTRTLSESSRNPPRGG